MNKNQISLFFAFIMTIPFFSFAQPERWQQEVKYEMEIDFNVNNHQFSGKQKIVFTNNSPDTLNRVFYHLYFNAFQPGSMMDVRSRTIMDPDPRVGDRIFYLKENEIGYHKVNALLQDGEATRYEVVGTILEVELAKPILPGSSTVLEMEFDSQVPVQIRRSGRDNKEGISYSMSQWYPKLCNYDYQGWHAHPYVGREFYGIWGDFDVKITIDKDYIVGGTGYLQEDTKEDVTAYEEEPGETKAEEGRKTWHFLAPDVHDFMWGADPDYKHVQFERKDGVMMHFYYQPGEQTENWEKLPQIMDRAFDFINKKYGQYPYKQYSFVQGGDGGMEYPMSTLITGHRSLGSLVGVSVHELMHSWYQMALGTNESLYAWMDEGFTSYATAKVMNYLRKENLIPGNVTDSPHAGSYRGYKNLASSGFEEPLTTHADHFYTNTSYVTSAYSKGAVFLHQLEYVIGKKALDQGMLDYFNTWKFKHPNANDFIRIMEKASDLELDWYREYFVNTTHQIDYGIDTLVAADYATSTLTLEKVGYMPMPLDVEVIYKDGTKEIYNIPLQIMRGNKPQEDDSVKYTVLEDWPWTNPTYEMVLPAAMDKIAKITIDPTERMADMDLKNNILELDEEK